MRARFVTLVAGVASLLALLSAPVAFAETAWWHFTSGARPTYLHAGASKLGVDEVQKVTLTGATKGKFLLANMSKSEVESGAFSCIGPPPEEEETPKFAELPYNATPAQVQKGLEAICGYGSGSVEVSGSVGEYVVKFKGALAERPLRLLNTELNPLFGTTNGTLEVTELSTGLPGTPDGEIVLTAENLGDTPISGAKVPVRIKDTLPPGLHATGIVAVKPLPKGESLNRSEPLACSSTAEAEEGKLTCEMTGTLAPYDQIEVRVGVDVQPGAKTGETNLASISGGGIEEASLRRAITVKDEPPPFGAEDYELVNEEEGGAQVTQAGAHPFQQTTTVALNQNGDTEPLENSQHHAEASPAGLAKDLSFHWPAGLIGNPSAFPRCTASQFNHGIEATFNACPARTAVGVATVTVQSPTLLHVATLVEPVFNLEPRPGEPARFAFIVELVNTPVFIDTAVRTGSDYGVTVTSSNITQITGLLSVQITIWGVPGDPRHDDSRGWACLATTRGNPNEGSCNPPEEQNPPALLSMPTSCTGALHSSVFGDSWSDPLSPGSFPKLAEYEMPALDGCNRLPFIPSIRVTPDTNAGSSPSGLNVDVHVPQEESLNANGLAEAAPRDITVALPEGVAVNPSSGDGLQACSEGLAGFTGFGELVAPGQTATFTERLPNPLLQGVNFCPDAAKLGTVRIKTPILPNPIEGSVYLASQNENPFGSLVALYLIAEDPVSGVVIKLAGETELTGSGRIVTTFKDSPQAPFEDAELHFFGGERAPLATPARCGAYTTMASLTPWSGNPAASASSTFNIVSGPNGAPCPGATLPFSPSLTGGTTNVSAGSFSPLTTTIARGDGQQNMQSVRLRMPPGLSGLLTGVKLCSEANANEGSCGPESLIGETTVSAGVGGDPVSVKGGRVYLTEKYAGAPFGLSIVNPVKAGPFDLEHDTSNPSQDPACDCVVVRARIEVDPITAALTVTTHPSGAHAIPHLIDGIPVQIKKVNVTINRPGFAFNPTNCNPMSITGSIASDENASSNVSVPLQVTNCAALGFKPQFSVSTSGKTSRQKGASLHVKLVYPKVAFGSQANIAKVKVDLPKQLPSRLTTLQKACPDSTFNANPAACPSASRIGAARATTPLLPVPLTGPVYFVSHGGAKFPELVIVLSGYGVSVQLHSETFINKAGITSSTFRTIPDVPVGMFELTLPQGKFSALAANGNLCTVKGGLKMPTAFTAQNGATLKQSTPIGVTGCAKHKKAKKARKAGHRHGSRQGER